MRRSWIAALAVLAVVTFAISPVAATVILPHAGGAASLSAPPRGAPALAATAPVATSAAPADSGKCPTPQNLADWTSAAFFNDALVSFSVPGYQNMSGPNFQTVPCLNTLPTYLPGFWMNISTNVPLLQAYVNIWGTLWPTPNQPLGDLPGFPYDGTQVTQKPMYIAAGSPDQASFYFDVSRYFYPGATVYFNVTLQSTAGTPTTINSGNALSQIAPAGSSLNATWKFFVNAPWWSPHFSQSILVSSTPSVIGGAVFEPNENQSFNVGIESIAATGLPGTPIPAALLTINITNDPGFNGIYGIPFGPANHTWQNLTVTVGPYPGAEIGFNVSAWLPWESGAHVDVIYSQEYWFNWSKGGGWAAPALGLAANAQIGTTPSVLASSVTTLASATPVNVSLTESTPNVTISSAIIRFHFSDADGSIAGIVPTHLVGQQTTYAVLPGFPSGGRVTFSLLAKDVFGNPLASGNYTYVESGAPSTNVTGFSSFFYVEAINATTGALVSGIPFTVSNASWSQTGVTTAFGYGLLQIPNGAGTLQLPYGTYTVSLTALGHTQVAKVTLGSPVPPTVRFWFANGPVTASSVIPLSPFTIGLIAGLIVLTAAFLPLFRWFQERQRKAEAERTRVTL